MSEKIVFMEFKYTGDFLFNKKFTADCDLSINFTCLKCSAAQYCLSNGVVIFRKYSTRPSEKLGGKYHGIIEIQNKEIWQEMKKICSECKHRQK